MARDSAPEQGKSIILSTPPSSFLRLPYHTPLEEMFGVDQGKWQTLIDMVFPAAKTVDAVVMALRYCDQRKLDIFKRPVHIVPMYSTVLRRMVETVWPGISEIRTTAHRTADYAGIDECKFGPEVVTKFDFPTYAKDGSVADMVPRLVKYPEYATYIVYRIVHGRKEAFAGPRVRWIEAYATAGHDVEAPNKMWQERPWGQLDKCAEAAALRRAFPEEVGNEYASEEMAGRTLIDSSIPVAIGDASPQPQLPPKLAVSAATAAKAPPPLPAEEEITEAEVVEETAAPTPQEVSAAASAVYAARFIAAPSAAVVDEISAEVRADTRLMAPELKALREIVAGATRRFRPAIPGVSVAGDKITDAILFYRWLKEQMDAAKTVDAATEAYAKVEPLVDAVVGPEKAMLVELYTDRVALLK